MAWREILLMIFNMFLGHFRFLRVQMLSLAGVKPESEVFNSLRRPQDSRAKIKWLFCGFTSSMQKTTSRPLSEEDRQIERKND